MFIISVVPPVVVVICTTLTTIHTSDSADDNIFYLPAFESCFRMPLSYDWVPMLVPLLVDILLFGITLYHAMQYRRFGVRLPLMSVIWRDGLIWFIVMFVVFGISTIIYARYTQDLIIPDA
ncbi:hypothetical protein JAAARDRAFT_30704 [Jaapia argillacea MUCL 33604]|uniref:Uncharacterized protein n=1 Tax=Jaapia argillacea MUCL 33604 TaxID=933084 RepID=A0A067Q9G4_9AGAM|nr:hypothetical protein JAAARDRAFT_30704 [Jaapia argillacea MUCL 33604]